MEEQMYGENSQSIKITAFAFPLYRRTIENIYRRIENGLKS